MRTETERQAHRVRVHIDQRPIESPNPTTGVALYQLAGIAAELLLFREVGGNREDTPVPRNDAPLHLKQDEHFHSGRPVLPGVEIFVNTESFRWERPKISYEEVVQLAYPGTGEVRYNVMWTKPDGQEGALRPGQGVAVVNEMTFDVRNTDKS